MNEFYEDKKCRLCGLADEENEFIFHTRDRYLVKKIAAVYSIWITPTDPLPKCICAKCFAKVSTAYKSYTQIKKLQTKWLDNVCRHEPNHNYIEALNFIQRANLSIKNFIEANYGEKLSKDAIESLLINALSGQRERIPTADAVVIQSSSGSSHVNLLSNGSVENYETTPDKSSTSHKAEDDDENMSLAKMTTNKASPTPPQEVKCKYCPLKFESLKLLAMHQIEHMQLSMPKLFQPKCLDKNYRRGRLISVQSRQSIRCLNCYLVFDDNKCILEHWSKAECDFYCQICGEEFAQSPKLLREHVSEVHGISYRSLKMQRDLSFLSMSEQQTYFGGRPKQKNDAKLNLSNQFQQSTQMEVSSSTTPQTLSPERPIKCRICNRDFRNFKACNSHMRAHKPPYAYNDTEQLNDMNTDAYMEPEPTDYEIEPPSAKQKFVNYVTAATCSSAATLSSIKMEAASLTPPLAATSNAFYTPTKQADCTEPVDMDLEPTMQVNSSTFSSKATNVDNANPTPTASSSTKPTTSTAPRGIRMKFVNRRSDLNGVNPAIKVKSLQDLKTQQNTATAAAATTCSPTPPLPQQNAVPSDAKPLQIIIAPSGDIKPMPNATVNCLPPRLLLNTPSPSLNRAPCSPQLAYDSLRPCQNVPTCVPAPPSHHMPLSTCAPATLPHHMSVPTCPPVQSPHHTTMPTCPPATPPHHMSVPICSPVLPPHHSAIPTCPPATPPHHMSGPACSPVLPPHHSAIPTCPPATPPHHTSVIVNSLQNQAISSFNAYEPPLQHNAFMSPTIKDEPMEFI